MFRDLANLAMVNLIPRTKCSRLYSNDIEKCKVLYRVTPTSAQCVYLTNVLTQIHTFSI